MRAFPAARSAVLALALALAALTACGGSDAGGSERGARLYASMGCVSCHGVQGGGGLLAPPLGGLAQHWDRARLADYLADPRVWLEKDRRLAELERRFSSQMPGVSLPEEDRLALAEHVLALAP